ncbi:uncharacterized protein LOC144645664 [Oculina patagonica]
MKLVYLLTALTFFLLLSYLTYPAEREETFKTQEKQDFFFKDFTHDTTVTGSWVDKDYVVKMEINSIKLNMKLVFEFTENKNSADVNSTPNGNRTPKYGKIHKAKKYMYGRNDSTCPEYKPFIPRLPDLIYPLSWRQDMTIKVSRLADNLWNGIQCLTECIWSCVTWIGEVMRNGVTWMGRSICNGVTWMGKSICNGVTWMGRSIWNCVIWVGQLIRIGVTWMSVSMWNCVTWMAETMWIGILWTGELFIPAFNYVADAVVKFYDEYLDDFVSRIQAYIVVLIWKDVLYTILTVFAMNFTLYVVYLLIKCTVNFVRRKWQARKDRIAAANLPPAPIKPIWRPKPKKKRRKNKNDW